jgi:hypothetical protein
VRILQRAENATDERSDGKKRRRYLTDDLYPASRVSEQKRVSEVQTNERNV